MTEMLKGRQPPCPVPAPGPRIMIAMCFHTKVLMHLQRVDIDEAHCELPAQLRGLLMTICGAQSPQSNHPKIFSDETLYHREVRTLRHQPGLSIEHGSFQPPIFQSLDLHPPFTGTN